MHFENFNYARKVLTFWYSLIHLIILLLFSIALYTTENQNFSRIVIRREFGTTVPARVSNAEKRLLRLQVVELRQSFQFTLLIIDGIVLLAGAGLSYLLAGKTLHPIHKMLEHQKEFLADASHELRTPLAAIQTACEVVLRGKEKTKDDYRQVVVQIYEETQRLGTLANDLFTLSRIEAGILPLHFEKLILSNTVREIIKELQPLFEKKQLILINEIDENVSITGDKDRIKQLILILLDNAKEFTPSGGTVTVSLTNKSEIILVVTDTGVGIQKQDQKKIFERFYQANSSRTGNGAGLGLSIAKWIADAHHATIIVESPPVAKDIMSQKRQKGSTFSVKFPKS